MRAQARGRAGCSTGQHTGLRSPQHSNTAHSSVHIRPMHHLKACIRNVQATSAWCQPARSISSWLSLKPRACLVQPGVLALGYTKITAPFSRTLSCTCKLLSQQRGQRCGLRATPSNRAAPDSHPRPWTCSPRHEPADIAAPTSNMQRKLHKTAFCSVAFAKVSFAQRPRDLKRRATSRPCTSQPSCTARRTNRTNSSPSSSVAVKLGHSSPISSGEALVPAAAFCTPAQHMPRDAAAIREPHMYQDACVGPCSRAGIAEYTGECRTEGEKTHLGLLGRLGCLWRRRAVLTLRRHQLIHTVTSLQWSKVRATSSQYARLARLAPRTGLESMHSCARRTSLGDQSNSDCRTYAATSQDCGRAVLAVPCRCGD
jgi:hypothetical protein